jgi:hypothetical protein
MAERLGHGVIRDECRDRLDTRPIGDSDGAAAVAIVARGVYRGSRVRTRSRPAQSAGHRGVQGRVSERRGGKSAVVDPPQGRRRGLGLSIFNGSKPGNAVCRNSSMHKPRSRSRAQLESLQAGNPPLLHPACLMRGLPRAAGAGRGIGRAIGQAQARSPRPAGG